MQEGQEIFPTLVNMVWRFGGKGSQDQSVNKWINNRGVFRIALATPGLLKSYRALSVACSDKDVINIGNVRLMFL